MIEKHGTGKIIAVIKTCKYGRTEFDAEECRECAAYDECLEQQPQTQDKNLEPEG